MKINLHIERLVLDEALLAGERAADVRAALQGELARLLAAPDAGGALRGIGAVDALPPLILPAERRPHDHLGPRIATAVSDGLGVGAQVWNFARTPHPSSAGFGKE